MDCKTSSIHRVYITVYDIGAMVRRAKTGTCHGVERLIQLLNWTVERRSGSKYTD
jgi:hypothetical protein